MAAAMLPDAAGLHWRQPPARIAHCCRCEWQQGSCPLYCCCTLVTSTSRHSSCLASEALPCPGWSSTNSHPFRLGSALPWLLCRDAFFQGDCDDGVRQLCRCGSRRSMAQKAQHAMQLITWAHLTSRMDRHRQLRVGLQAALGSANFTAAYAAAHAAAYVAGALYS